MTSIPVRLDRFAPAADPAAPADLADLAAATDGAPAAAFPATAAKAAIRTLVAPSPGGAHVLCIPWAGASIERFFAWKRHLPAGVGLSGVQLPGRGARVHEPSPTDLVALLDEIAAEYLALRDPPRILFGHSFGALIAFEIATRVSRAAGQAGGDPFVRLVVSGLSAPSVIAEEERIAHLDDDAFSAQVHALNGMPPEIARSPESLRYFMTVLRCDFRLYESYAFDANRPPLRCPIAVCSGRDDPSVSEHGLNAWAALTTGECRRHDFDGDHFFIADHAAAMLGLALDAESTLAG
ncbi:thioesterase domain-containing protein [Burkholderia pseudomallei]|uniref:thioesterase II family protein n=1 Tax=Burkholderia pseudomallei TaxID=28450 RepID=UPI0009823FBF|nr:alpha/beta fold hydrolase [Burkholderia pseudomallei]MBF3897685.1 thioesterase [Burkholderia pseudomallei]OMR76913.1 thioesterase [Burkholderia pseudomallei]CAJ8363141.1 thioesterase domain-containing protein [Burkholderia pseudomallei]